MRIRNEAVALGFVLLSMSLLAACGGANDARTGRVSIVLSSTAAAVPKIASPGAGVAECGGSTWDHCLAPQAASVTFSSILARTLEGKLVAVTIDLPATVDLLALVNGQEATLPPGFLPPGTYDQFVVVMTQLELTLASGAKIAITPPGGGWTAIIPVSPPFTVAENETTTVALHFRRDLSFVCASGGWEFHPEFECRGAGEHH